MRYKKNFIREISFQELINRRSHLAEVVTPWSSGFKYQSSNPTWPFSYRIIKLGEFLVGNLRCNDWKGTIFSVDQFYRARLAWLYENVLPNGIQSKINHLGYSKRLNFEEQDSNWNFFNEPGEILSDHQTKTNLEWKLLKRVFRNLQQRRLLLISTSLIQISMKKNLIYDDAPRNETPPGRIFFFFSLSWCFSCNKERKKETNKFFLYQRLWNFSLVRNENDFFCCCCCCSSCSVGFSFIFASGSCFPFIGSQLGISPQTARLIFPTC